MATIRRFPFVRHLSSEPSQHVLHFRGGRLVRSGRGLAFWFLPLSATLAEVPCDDRDVSFLFHGRSADFQDVVVQGTITYRVTDPETLARRVDLSLDPRTGRYRETPLEQLTQILTRLAQQLAVEYVLRNPVRTVLAEGVEQIRQRVSEGLVSDAGLRDTGLEVVSVRVASVQPTSELEKALQTPTRESIQQASDEATFQRRALAVEKERAIKENELQSEIELARREEDLIAQRGKNDRRLAREMAEAAGIEANGEADRERLRAGTEADGIRVVEEARVGAERNRMDIYRDLPPKVLIGLAAQEFAGKLNNIERIHIAPDSIGPMLGELAAAGARLLDRKKELAATTEGAEE